MATNSRKPLTEAAEIKRLRKLFRNMEQRKLQTIEGLIIEAARLRVRLNTLWEDLQENGEYELFQQGEAPAYERERPASKIYSTTTKQYLTTIAKLTDLLPEEDTAKDELNEFI